MSNYDPRITAYFGDAVLRAGFMPLPHLFLRHYRHLGLSQLQAMFLLQLMEIAWDISDPPNTVTKLAERLGVERRTVQSCSRDVHALGLVEIFDQWDDAGAQVENGYDLSPLFRCLSALAPEHKPVGQPRTRRPRSTDEEQPLPFNAEIAPPRSGDHSPLRSGDHSPPRSGDHPPLRSGDHSPPVVNDHGGRDPAVAPPVQERSRLSMELKESLKNTSKKNSKNTKNTKNTKVGGGGGNEGGEGRAFLSGVTQASLLLDQDSAPHPHVERALPAALAAVAEQPRPASVPAVLAAAAEPRPASSPALAAPGFSLRWQTPLIAEEVNITRQLLDRFGLNTPVATAVAPTLHPAEAWALWLYTRAARLTPAWLAKQVYHFGSKQPQSAAISSRYDAVGRVLAALPPAEAEQLVDMVDEHCPHAAVALVTLLAGFSAPAQAAATAIWRSIAEQRGGERHLALHPPPAASAAPQALATPEAAGLWRAVLAHLQGSLTAADWHTWLAPCALLELDAALAVVGTPNTFVRDELAEHFHPALTAAFAACGHPVRVEIVISAWQEVGRA